MTSRRILSSLATVAISLSMMQPAFAAATSTDDVLTELQSFNPDTICAERTGKNLGKCISDVIKRISGLRNDFSQALTAERKEWYAAHGQLGISSEYSEALQAYLASVKTKRETFTELQRGLEKAFFAIRKQVLDSAESTDTPSFTREVKGADMEKATAKCAKQSDSRGLRICLRQQLRLQDPATRLLNVSPAGIRSTK